MTEKTFPQCGRARTRRDEAGCPRGSWPVLPAGSRPPLVMKLLPPTTQMVSPQHERTTALPTAGQHQVAGGLVGVTGPPYCN